MRNKRRIGLLVASLLAVLGVALATTPASASVTGWQHTSYNTNFHCGGNVPADHGHFNVCVVVNGNSWQGVILWTQDTSNPVNSGLAASLYTKSGGGSFTFLGTCSANDFDNINQSQPPTYWACWGPTTNGAHSVTVQAQMGSHARSDDQEIGGPYNSPAWTTAP